MSKGSLFLACISRPVQTIIISYHNSISLEGHCQTKKENLDRDSSSQELSENIIHSVAAYVYLFVCSLLMI